MRDPAGVQRRDVLPQRAQRGVGERRVYVRRAGARRRIGVATSARRSVAAPAAIRPGTRTPPAVARSKGERLVLHLLAAGHEKIGLWWR